MRSLVRSETRREQHASVFLSTLQHLPSSICHGGGHVGSMVHLPPGPRPSKALLASSHHNALDRASRVLLSWPWPDLPDLLLLHNHSYGVWVSLPCPWCRYRGRTRVISVVTTAEVVVWARKTPAFIHWRMICDIAPPEPFAYAESPIGSALFLDLQPTALASGIFVDGCNAHL